MTKKTRRDLYAEITETVAAALEGGTIPWERPWTAANGSSGALTEWNGPRSASTGKLYRGMNTWWLGMIAWQQGYTSPWWLTFRQAKKLGGHVRKGEK